MDKEKELEALLEEFQKSLITFRKRIKDFKGLSKSLGVELPEEMDQASLDFTKKFTSELTRILDCYKKPTLSERAKAIQEAIKEFMFVVQNPELCNRFLQMSVSIAFLNGDVDFNALVDIRNNGYRYLLNEYGDEKVTIVKGIFIDGDDE